VVAELLAAYLLLILALRLAAWLPGASGQLARRGAGLLTPPVLRRALDGLLGGVLLAQMVLAPVAARAAPVAQPDRAPAAAASALAGGGRIASASAPAGADLQPSVAGRSRSGAGQSPGAAERPPTTAGHVPGMARALPATSTVPPPTWVPLPTWLGGSQEPGASAPASTTAGSEPGPGAAEPTSPQAPGGHGPEASAAGGGTGLIDPAETRSYVIQPGDTLWDVAEAHLSPSQRSPSRIDRYWRQVHAANRDVLGDDPDLIHPGVRVVLPPFQPARTGGG
jgi:resuscitation-promoting factor RpfA